MPEGQCLALYAIQQQDFFASLGLDRHKGHRIFSPLAEQEGTTPGFTLFGTLKYVVYGFDHGVAGAEVGVQRMQAATGGVAGAQIGVDVRSAESIDRLLRVTDQEQAGVGAIVFDPVNAFEDAVLHGIGVLELIDQRHRELLANQDCQTLAAFCL